MVCTPRLSVRCRWYFLNVLKRTLEGARELNGRDIEAAAAASCGVAALACTLWVRPAAGPLWALAVVLAAGTPAGMLAPLAAGLDAAADRAAPADAPRRSRARRMKMLNDRRTAVLAHRAFADRLTGLLLVPTTSSRRSTTSCAGRTATAATCRWSCSTSTPSSGSTTRTATPAGDLFLRQVGELVSAPPATPTCPPVRRRRTRRAGPGHDPRAAQLAERIRRQVAVLRVEPRRTAPRAPTCPPGSRASPSGLGRGAVQRGRRRRALEARRRGRPGPGRTPRAAGTPRSPRSRL